MMNFIVLTLSITVGMMLSSIITMVIMFKLMGNAKVMAWFTNYYVKQVEKISESFEEAFKDLDV